MSVFVPPFEEKHEAFTATGYDCTNEEPEVMRRMLKHELEAINKKQFPKAGGIASAGEVPLFVLIPHCKDIKLVDHSFRSIAASFLKIMVLSDIGPKEMLRLLSKKEIAKLTTVFKKHYDSPEFPAHLKAKTASLRFEGIISNYTLQDAIRKEWCLVPESIVELAAKHLDRLSYIHGDLKDLEPYGPFDLFYASNSQDHTTRSGAYTGSEQFAKLVKKNGYLLATVSPNKFTATTWKKIDENSGYRSGWSHTLFKKTGT